MNGTQCKMTHKHPYSLIPSMSDTELNVVVSRNGQPVFIIPALTCTQVSAMVEAHDGLTVHRYTFAQRHISQWEPRLLVIGQPSRRTRRLIGPFSGCHGDGPWRGEAECAAVRGTEGRLLRVINPSQGVGVGSVCVLVGGGVGGGSSLITP